MKTDTLTGIKEKDKRGEKIKEKIGCRFIRINPDGEYYDILVEIGRIQNHIIKLTKKLTKNQLKSY